MALSEYHPMAIIIALGCNIGPRRETFELACGHFERLGVHVERRSRLYWTRPWGVTDQPDFLNAAVAVRTRWRPLELLRICLHVEQLLGRRRARRWGPRRIDLDLLLYGNHRLDRPELTLPHPGIPRRDFVLEPLIDLGVAPPAHLAPRGWRALERQLGDAERSIIRAQPWS